LNRGRHGQARITPLPRRQRHPAALSRQSQTVRVVATHLARELFRLPANIVVTVRCPPRARACPGDRVASAAALRGRHVAGRAAVKFISQVRFIANGFRRKWSHRFFSPDSGHARAPNAGSTFRAWPSGIACRCWPPGLLPRAPADACLGRLYVSAAPASTFDRASLCVAWQNRHSLPSCLVVDDGGRRAFGPRRRVDTGGERRRSELRASLHGLPRRTFLLLLLSSSTSGTLRLVTGFEPRLGADFGAPVASAMRPNCSLSARDQPAGRLFVCRRSSPISFPRFMGESCHAP